MIKPLSEKILFLRTDRPNEWQMDEFARDAKKLQQQNDKLTAGNAALEDTEQRLRIALKDESSACSQLAADNQALRNELEALKASQNKIKADAIREAVESNRTIGYVEDYFGTITNNEKIEINDLIEYANKLEAGK